MRELISSELNLVNGGVSNAEIILGSTLLGTLAGAGYISAVVLQMGGNPLHPLSLMVAGYYGLNGLVYGLAAGVTVAVGANVLKRA